MTKSALAKDFTTLVRNYFCNYLIKQKNVSMQTVNSYRDTFKLLICFAEKNLRKSIKYFDLEDLNTKLVLAFLDYIENERKNCIRSRNIRLAAIRSFLKYAVLHEPALYPAVNKILAIPMKRFRKPQIDFLNQKEIKAILTAPDNHNWSDRRDRILFKILYNTGARVSEITEIKCKDIGKGNVMTLKLHGKGRKDRVIPLWKSTSKELRKWLNQIDNSPEKPLCPNRFGEHMTRSGVEKRLKTAVSKAKEKCPSLKKIKVSPHVIRHTTAMHLLQSEVDLSVIAIWLGHESISTTHMYLQANIEMKEKALAKIKEPQIIQVRFKPTSDILKFLDTL